MKNITVTISGKQVTIREKDFWSVYGILKKEAIRANVREYLDFNRNEYRLTDKEYEGIIENIAESIFYEEDEYLDWAGIVREHLQYALEDWDIDLEERRKAI